MKHIKLFEQFIAEKKAGDYIAYIDDKRSPGGTDKEIINDYGLQVMNRTRTGFEIMGALEDIEAFVADYNIILDEEPRMNERVNEDLGVIDIALGVATGIAGLWAVVQGLPLVGRALGSAAEALADQVEARAKQVAKGKRKGLIEEIIKKFDGDTNLKQMYQDLPEYMEKGGQNIVSRNNTERRKQLTAIGNYIKTKLTPEEMQYFTDISSMLRTGDIK